MTHLGSKDPGAARKPRASPPTREAEGVPTAHSRGSFLLSGPGATEARPCRRCSARALSDTAVGGRLAAVHTLPPLQAGGRAASPRMPSRVFYQQSSPCGGPNQASQPTSSRIHFRSRPNLNWSPWAPPTDTAPSQHSSTERAPSCRLF